MQHILGLVRRCVEDYHMIEPGDRIAVGVDARDGYVAVSGWEGAAAGGAAARAGVRAGDYLLAADGKETLSSADLLRARWQHHVGDEMTLTLWRHGEILTVTLELTEAVEK